VKWLEVSLTLESELAEAVADLLARFAPGGVSDDENWAEAWKRHYHPIRVGRRLLILPAWLPPPADDDLLLILDPGMAFGTGTHPTTQLVLAILEEVLRPGQDVVDLGCGSGILSVAAARLEAGRVLALDIDPIAVNVARENLRRNRVDDRVRVELGSLERLRDPDRPIQADVVLANILAPVLEGTIKDGLADALRPGGILVLSGILQDQVDALVEVAHQHGLEMVESRADGDWRALVMNRRPPP
jgi:ribosomal protein L11 methyltransferase